MASLTHICMWSENGWKQITAEQAAKLFPLSTVSAHSGLFMCELCGQYVCLTSGDVNIRHFRHSSYEKSKNCPERTGNIVYSLSYNAQEHDLPIRITGVSSNSFRFEIGLLRAPIRSFSSDFCVVIQPTGTDICYVFKKERLHHNTITYLSIGDQPYSSYSLSIQNGSDTLYRFWPKVVTGIDPQGTLFEKATGRILPKDADVELQTEYYLLIDHYIGVGSHRNIQLQEIARKRIRGDTWFLYVVKASVFCEEAARFFWDFRCRLTEHPVSMQMVWPLFVEGDYVLKYSHSSICMLVNGYTSTIKAFPNAILQKLYANDQELYKVYAISAPDRQQLVSVGRTNALQYTYLWHEPLEQVGTQPQVSITDLTGTVVAGGETHTLPPQKTLCFRAEYDGEIIISYDNHVVERRKLYADTPMELDTLAYGCCVQVLIGLDVMWQICFEKKQSTAVQDETTILRQITSSSGGMIPAPHTLRNIMVNMQQYPKLCQWIQKCIRHGVIGERSYRKLQNLYREMYIE